MKEGSSDKKRWTKCIQCGICLIMVLLLLAGCGEPKADETGRPTDQTLAAPEDPGYHARPDAVDGYVHSYPVGTTVCYDLNGDGVGEDITVNAHEYETGNLIIGNASVEFWSAAPTGYFTILNLNAVRNVLLVGISDYGPSDDNMTTLYAYDGTSITEVGFFDDIVGKNTYDYAGAVCHGDGTITAKTRLDVLGTWNATCRYYADVTGVWDITDFYQYEDWDGNQTGWEVTAKTDLLMYEDRQNPDIQTIVRAGTAMRMTGVCKGDSYGTHWAAFTVDSGDKVLWLATEEVDWQTHVQSLYGYIESEEAFDGFFYAG